MFDSKKGTGAAKACRNFIINEEDSVLVAQFPQLPEVFRRIDPHACGALETLAAVNSPHTRVLAKAVGEICAACETECAKFPDIADCRACRSACQTCAAECRKIAA